MLVGVTPLFAYGEIEMITWVTVWVLTVSLTDLGVKASAASDYQLTYATKETCERQKIYHKTNYRKVRCDFQQVPVYKAK